jgi:hypothetical protein
MTVTKKGWNRKFMASLFKKEATYNAGVTMDSSNACSLIGFDLEKAPEFKIENDKGEVTGKEHGYDQEILSYGYKFTYKESKAKPNSLAGFASLVLGSTTATKDGANTAYLHKIVPVTVGTALPSISVEEKHGDLQYRHDGVKGNTLKLSGTAGGFVTMDVGLIGAGSGTESTTDFAAAITESWLKVSGCKVWLESGAEISISNALTQATEDISSATPDDLYPRLKSFEWSWDNALEGQPGFGGAGLFQDLDYGRRKVDLKFSLIFNGETELDYFLNQTACAIEFDLVGALVAVGSTMYFGFQLIVPRFKIKNPVFPKGGVGDTLTQDFECEVFDDGTNSASILQVYNAQAAYLGA